jgi:hypothetical protein
MVAVNNPVPLPLCTLEVPLWPGTGEGEVDQHSPLEVIDPMEEEHTLPPLTALLVVMEVIAVVVLVQPICARTYKCIEPKTRRNVIRFIILKDVEKCAIMLLVGLDKDKSFII